MKTKPFVAFMAEREKIRRRRAAGVRWPWTTDKILQSFKFTNVHREHDRTSRSFMVEYAPHVRKKPETVELGTAIYNAGIARYFGTEAFYSSIGWQVSHAPARLLAAVERLRRAGGTVFTGAYVITNGGRAEPKERVVVSYLDDLWRYRTTIADGLLEGEWRLAAETMRSLDGFGGTGFMTKEVLLDVLMMYPQKKLPLIDRDNWTPVGPGARRGMNRVMGQPFDAVIHPNRLLPELTAIWKEAAPLYNEEMEDTINISDVQFQLCEFDKYERARLRQGRPRNRYTPPKE